MPGGGEDWQRGPGAACSQWYQPRTIASCSPFLSCLICKIEVIIPSLPILQGFHKDARGQQLRKCALGIESVFYDPTFPAAGSLELQETVKPRSLQLWLVDQGLLSGSTARRRGRGQSQPFNQVYNLSWGAMRRGLWAEFPMPGKLGPTPCPVGSYRFLPGLPPPRSPPQGCFLSELLPSHKP